MARIMIVDDDIFLHKVLERILSIGGHQVVGHASDGAEAIEEFMKMNPRPDIILMDHRMPVMNGITATREIKHLDPHSRILFVSADDSVVDEAVDAGAVGFLTKPVRAATLLASIEGQVEQKSS